MSLPQVTVLLEGVPITGVTLSGVTISHGRRQITEQPAPNTLSVTMLTPAAPFPFFTGAKIAVEAVHDGTTTNRFTGTVIQIAVGRYTSELIAVSNALGRLARTRIPDLPLPFTTIGANIVRVLDAAAKPLDDSDIVGILSISGSDSVYDVPGYDTTIDPGTVNLIEGLSVGGNALDMCQQLAGWEPFGLFWETNDSEIYFYDALRRSDVTPSFALEPGQVLNEWIAEQAVDAVINLASVEWGAEGDKAAAANLDSLNQFGVFSLSIDAPIDDELDALTWANRLVANGNQPAYVTDSLEIDLATEAVDDELTSDILAMEMNDVIDVSQITIPGLPSLMYVEGWNETITASSYRFDLALSDIRLTRPPQTWEQVPELLKWEDIPGTVRWTDLITDYLQETYA